LNLDESIAELLKDYSRKSCVALLDRIIKDIYENCKNR